MLWGGAGGEARAGSVRGGDVCALAIYSHRLGPHVPPPQNNRRRPAGTSPPPAFKLERCVCDWCAFDVYLYEVVDVDMQSGRQVGIVPQYVSYISPNRAS